MHNSNSSILETHVNNIKRVREHVPQESRAAFDNVTGAGDVAVGAIRFGEAVKNIIDFFKKDDPKEIEGPDQY